MIYVTLVNTQTDTQTAFDPLYCYLSQLCQKPLGFKVDRADVTVKYNHYLINYTAYI